MSMPINLGINGITVENAYAELAPEGPVYDSLVSFKRVNDLATSNLVQRALETYVTVGGYQDHLRRSCQLYSKRRDAISATSSELVIGRLPIASRPGSARPLA